MSRAKPAKAVVATTALQAMRPAIVTGAVVIAVFFGGLGSWAAIAPLQSAAVASGVLNVESSRKTIQHLEGGIVEEIFVREGDAVKAGQDLIRLDSTQARAILAQLQNRRETMKALEARLVAERDNRDLVVFNGGQDLEEPSKAVAGEASIFEARRRALESEQSILENRIAQFEEEMTGLRGQISAQGTQLGLIDKELSALEKLLARKLASMQRVIELKRERAEIVGDRNQQLAAIARIKQSIAEEKLKILDLRTARVNEVVEQLREVHTSLSDIDERIVAAADVLARTNVVAPLDGTIVNLRVHTLGGVIGAGEAVMDIVPDQEGLIVDARVNPTDIDSVTPGMQAQVILTAFSRRTVAPLEGIVASVSADRLTDPRTAEPYYLARVRLPDSVLADRDDLALSAGMQAEVMIITGEQTALQYLFRPVEQSFNRAMREQ